ncbi:MAG: hypothetical protein JOZ63_20345 [Planctomycetaceae bacterium]|nr:hypothetical protein [Planctomycetaceae bacterium]
MKRLLEFPLQEKAGSVVVEVEDAAPAQGVERVGRGDRVVTQVSQTFEDALDKVGPMAAAVASKIQSIATSTEEVTVEFAIKMSAEAGIVLAAGGVEANFKGVQPVWLQLPCDRKSLKLCGKAPARRIGPRPVTRVMGHYSPLRAEM